MNTPLEVVANVSRVVSMVVDRRTGCRAEYPLLCAYAVHQALKNFSIDSHVLYGHAAWIEILEDDTVAWAGAWGEHFHFWVETVFGDHTGEVIDITPSSSHLSKASSPGFSKMKSKWSAPMIWTNEIPKFYRYGAVGIAEAGFDDHPESKEAKLFNQVMEEVAQKSTPLIASQESENGALPRFLNEPIVCSDRKILDDQAGTFRLFDRALTVKGMPKFPF